MKKIKEIFVVSYILFGLGLILFGCTNESPVNTGPNTEPKIVNLSVEPDTITSGQTAKITCIATDEDGDKLNYLWSVTSGNLNNQGNVTYYTPDGCCGGQQEIYVQVRDKRGGVVTEKVVIEVQ